MLQMLVRLTIAVGLLALGFVSPAGAQSSSAPAPPPMMKGHQMTQSRPSAPTKASPAVPKVSKQSPAADYTPTVRFRLRTELAEGKMAFVGVGGDIEGVVNPTLRVAEGDVVQVGLINGDGVEHDVVFPDFKAGTDRVNRKGASSVTVFRADQGGRVRVLLLAAGAPSGGHGRQDRRGRRQGSGGGVAALGEHRARSRGSSGSACARSAPVRSRWSWRPWSWSAG